MVVGRKLGKRRGAPLLVISVGRFSAPGSSNGVELQCLEAWPAPGPSGPQPLASRLDRLGRWEGPGGGWAGLDRP